MEWPRPWYSNLWAPWRFAYIKSGGRKESCVFCEALSMDDEKALILYRGSHSYIILNKYPYNSGHLMVVSNRHVPSIEDLGPDEISEIGFLVKASVIALKRVYKPHGFNIGANIGEASGAGIAGHFHVHVVPRWVGDTNYITVVSGTKVVPQSLEDSYNSLKGVVKSVIGEVLGGGYSGRG